MISRRLPEAALARAAERFRVTLHESETRMPPEALAMAARDADALLVMATDRIDGPFIRTLPDEVRVLATLSVGHEHIDLAAARKRGLAVLHTPDILSDAVAEMGMLLLLGAARRAREGDLLLRSGSWAGWSPTQLLGRQLGGARLGIFGMGRIGRVLASGLKATEESGMGFPSH